MSLCGPTRSAYVKYAGGAEPRLRCGAHGARTGVLRCLGHRRNLLRPAWHLFAAGVRAQGPHDGARPQDVVAQADPAQPVAPWPFRVDAVEPQAVSLAHALDGSYRRGSTRRARATALVGCGNPCRRWGGRVSDGDRLDLAGGTPVAPSDRATILRGEWKRRRTACLGQSVGGAGNCSMGADPSR